jgi:putative DNA primase/helicase
VLWESFTPRLVAVKSWAGLNSVDSVRKAAELLADYGWLARETVQSGDTMGRGRPSDRYLVHPALLAGRPS